MQRDWRPATRLLNVFVDQQPAEKTTGIVFSPERPDTCIVLYEEHPPFVHDLRKAGFLVALEQVKAGLEPDPVRLSDETVLPNFRARQPAVAAAYRADTGEFAIAFGEDDTAVYRFHPRSGTRLEPVAIENPTAVHYSPDGQFLVAGSASGEVVTNHLTADGVTVMRTTRLGSRVVQLGIEDKVETKVFAATDYNGLCSFHLHADEEEDAPIRHGADVEGRGLVDKMKLKALAVSDHGIVAYGGIGNEVWLQSSYGGQGQVFALTELERIHALQFVDVRNELVVVSDGCVKVLKVIMDAERRAGVDANSLTFRSHERFPLVAAHKYGDMLCFCQIVPVD